MKPQHLSDEAVAAFADGVLSGHARDRAARHLNDCTECREAVRVQREAAVALRSAPPPALPTNLVDRLRVVPLTAPLPAPAAGIDSDGNPLLATFAPTAAFVPSSAGRLAERSAGRTARPGTHRSWHPGRTTLAVALLAGVAGAVVGGVAASSEGTSTPTVHPVNHVGSGGVRAPAPVDVFHARITK